MITVKDWIGIADVAVGAITAVTVLYVGHLLSARARRIEERISLAERLIEVRIELFRKAANELNDVFCYLSYVGQWRELTPEDIVNRKRTLDKLIYGNAPFFSSHLLATYEEFMASAFVTEQGRGTAARIRANFGRHREESTRQFVEGWEQLFVSSEDVSSRFEVRHAYNELMRVFRSEFIRGYGDHGVAEVR